MGYIHLYYEDYEKQYTSSYATDLNSTKRRMLAEQMGKFKTIASRNFSEPISEGTWEDADFILNESSTDLTKRFYSEDPRNANPSTSIAFPEGSLEGLTAFSATALKQKLKETATFSEFYKGMQDILERIIEDFSSQEFYAAFTDSVMNDLETMKTAKKGMTYEKIAKEILKNNGKFIEAKTIKGIKVDAEVQRLYALLFSLEQLNPPSIINAPEFTKTRSNGTKFKTTLIKELVKLNSAWTKALVGWAGETAPLLFLPKAHEKGLISILDGVKRTGAGITMIDQGLEQELANLKSFNLKTTTVNKEDFSFTMEENGMKIHTGFNVKESTLHDRDYIDRINVKVQSGTNLLASLVMTNLISDSRFVYQLQNTGFGLSSHIYGPFGHKRNAGRGEFTNDYINERWKNYTDVIGVGMAAYALAGYGAIGDRAMFFVWNGKVISIKRILEELVAPGSDTSIMKAYSNRAQLTDINKNNIVGNVLNPIDSKIRSDKISPLSVLQQIKIDFSLNLALSHF